MNYELIIDRDPLIAEAALFDNGMKARFWEDQNCWALSMPNDIGSNLVTFYSYSSLDEVSRFVDFWNYNVAKACNEVNITAQQWWYVFKTCHLCDI